MPDFDSIYQQNLDNVYRICMGYVNGNAGLAEDLVQEVFIKVWQYLDSFRQDAKISTWIYRITVNTCLMELRKQKYVRLENAFEMMDDSTDFKDHEHRYAKMYSCIHTLKKEDRALILLDLEEVPQKEISEILGISHEAVRVRMHRIKKSLTKCVQNGNLQ